MTVIKESVRIDKWLWAARFYKTRSMATDAIKGGKIHINGNRIKPGKVTEIGQIVSINKSPQRFEVEILAISDKRGNFTIAQMLYQETEKSISQREKDALMRKLANQGQSTENRRPTKRNRRQIIQFTQALDD